MEEGLENGFPVEGQRFDDVVANKSAATVSDARYDGGQKTHDHPTDQDIWIPGRD